MDVNNILEEEEFRYLKFQDFSKNFMLLKKEEEYSQMDIQRENAEFLGTFRKSNCVDYLANDILNHNEKTRLYRRIYWPLLLKVYDTTDIDELIKEIKIKRECYKQDKEEYVTKPNNLDIQKLDPQIFHPLCSDDKNPWILKQKNQELKDEIKQDILRTHSDRPIFQNENIRVILNEILFIWAKKNPTISYKQGMNEILAIFFIINYRDRADPTDSLETLESLHSSSNDTEKNREKCFRIFTFLFNQDEIEADTYILFDHFLHMVAKYLFATSVDDKKIQVSKNTCKSVLLQKCTYIFHKILKNSDKMLYNHLISLSIEPQIFLLRWVRLFYCREFQIEDVIILWDYFFSDCYIEISKMQESLKGDSSSKSFFEYKGDSVEIAHKTSDIFPLVDYFSISMILFIRSFLLENDETCCLRRLFKYPPVENIRTLIDLAFKIKYKNEKKEKHAKRDDFFITNKMNMNAVAGTDSRGENLMHNVSTNGTSSSYTPTGDVSIVSSNFNVNIENPRLNMKITNNYKPNDLGGLTGHSDRVIKQGGMNNDLNIFEINEQMKKRTSIESHTGLNYQSPSKLQLHNSNDMHDKFRNISNDNNLNLSIINGKLNEIINNLNILSFNLNNEKHRIELQHNILLLDGIKKNLQFLEKRESFFEGI